jgi:hypothetical protein
MSDRRVPPEAANADPLSSIHDRSWRASGEGSVIGGRRDFICRSQWKAAMIEKGWS